ncbi:MAG: hypothetical protein NZO16_04725 [Deltaproteobacteria bacterium]|nr:hypothetical protein [Deltaproteobacteria bacterium]
MYNVDMRFVLVLCCFSVFSQEVLPRDRHWDSRYHPYPDYRESEGHPLRIAAYILHPVGWVLRETITRPLSYLASRNDLRRSIMGYRFDGDFAMSSCFAVTQKTDCRELPPFKSIK